MKDDELNERLDDLLQTSAPLTDGKRAALERAIVDRLETRDPLQALLDWLLAGYWRPATAAALPLLFGFALGFGTVDAAPDDFFEDLATLTFYDAGTLELTDE